jgi:hypothetical protein
VSACLPGFLYGRRMKTHLLMRVKETSRETSVNG